MVSQKRFLFIHFLVRTENKDPNKCKYVDNQPLHGNLDKSSLNEKHWNRYSIVWCDLIVPPGASAKDQCACESKSREQCYCTQEPPLATAQARAWESTTKYSNAPLLDLLHSSPQHSTYINSPEATTNHSYKISMVCIIVIRCMDKWLPWKSRRVRHGDRFQH